MFLLGFCQKLLYQVQIFFVDVEKRRDLFAYIRESKYLKPSCASVGITWAKNPITGSS
jgi:hypothetical protein